MTAAVLKPEERLEQASVSVVTEAKALVVRDQVTLDLAGDKLGGIKALLKECDDVFDPVIAANYKAHQAAIQAKRKVSAPLLEVESVLKRGIGNYHQEQFRLRVEAERKAAAEAERQRQEAEAEQRRLQAEAEARHAQEVEDEIEMAEVLGASAEEIRAIAEQPLPLIAVPQPVFMPAPPPPAPNIEMPKGTSVRTKWTVTSVDVLQLAQYIVQHREHRNLLMPNMSALNQLASALKGAMQIPGVTVDQEQVVSQRAR